MGVEEPKHQIDFSEGEVVSIIDGPFKGFDGAVSEIDASKGTLKVDGQHVWSRHSSRVGCPAG